MVYANGYLVGSWNMPEGLAVTPSLLASSAITTLAVSNTVRSLVIPDQFILNGANVIAVEVPMHHDIVPLRSMNYYINT